MTTNHSTVPVLPDGLVIVVKRECETCRMVVPVIAQLRGSGTTVTLYVQDDPSFPEGLNATPDADLAVSWHHDIETVPTVMRVKNGVEIERFAPIPNEPRANRRAIFFCGRHEPRKGLEYLLKAHATLPDDVDLWIASDGPETDRLKREWAGDARVQWLGRISDAEKASRLRQAAVFCAPSLGGESFGVVLIEAMAANTPIVASSLDGYMNVATNMIDAILVEPADIAALEAGLRRILDDPELAAALVERGARRATEFSMKNLALRYEEIYRRVLSSHSVRVAPVRHGRIRAWWSIAKRLRALASNSIRRMLVK